MVQRLLSTLVAAQVGLCVVALIAAFQVWALLSVLEVSVDARSVLTSSMLTNVDQVAKQQADVGQRVSELRSTVLEARQIDKALVSLASKSRTVQAICSALLGVLLLASCATAWIVWRATK
jgi:hypothetical protein